MDRGSAARSTAVSSINSYDPDYRRALRATSCWRGHCLGPKPGPTMWGVARAPACRLRAPWPPSRRGHGRGWSGRWTQPGRPPGWPGRGCTGIIASGGRGEKSAPRRRSAPSRGKHRSGGPAASGRSQRSWRWWRRKTGVGGRRATGPQAPGGRTGGGSPGRRPCSPTGVGGSWSVGV